MKETDIAHLAGFFDAAGNITVSVAKDPEYRLNYALRPMLRIQRSDDEDPLMGKLMAYCDEQGVRYGIIEKSHGEGGGQSVELNVKDTDSIRRFLEPMMDYFATSFPDAVLMLTEVLPAIEEEKHRSKEGFYELMGIVEELRESDTEREIKYTQDFFEDEWSVVE